MLLQGLSPHELELFTIYAACLSQQSCVCGVVWGPRGSFVTVQVVLLLYCYYLIVYVTFYC